MKKERSSNIELLRIIAMLMIIVSHIWCHCINNQLLNDSVYFNSPQIYKRLFILGIISPIGNVANGIFILISGYFLIEKKIDLKKVSKKLLIQNFYATFILVIFSIILYKYYTKASISLISFDFFNNGSWFIGYYFSILLFAHFFLNKMLNKIRKEQHLLFLVVLFALIQFWWPMSIVREISGGLTVFINGIFMYSLGGYIKKYNPFKNIKTSFFVYTLFALIGMVIVTNYTSMSTQIELYYEKGNENFIQSVYTIVNTSYITIISAISLFEIFRRMKIKKNRVINFIASSTLMIYLLHDNEFVYSLWNLLDWIKYLYFEPKVFLYKYAIWTLGIFEVGIIIYSIYCYMLKLVPIIFKKLFIKTP